MEQSITHFFIYTIAYNFVLYGGLFACIGLMLVFAWPQYGLAFTFIKNKLNLYKSSESKFVEDNTELPDMSYYKYSPFPIYDTIGYENGVEIINNKETTVYNVIVYNSEMNKSFVIATFAKEQQAMKFTDFLLDMVKNYIQ